MDGMKDEGYRMIAIDQRGFGESTYNQPCGTYKDWAEDVILLCTELKIEKVILNGWSFGGAISQKVS